MGGDGADTLMGRGGDDILDGGGSPADTASYAEAASGVTVDLGIAGPQNTGEGFDTLIGIENLTGSAFRGHAQRRRGRQQPDRRRRRRHAHRDGRPG